MTINFVGDIGIFKKFEDLGIDPFLEVKLPRADMNIGNFEFISTEDHTPFFYDVQTKYNCSLSYLRQLKIETFDGLGLANNHVLDYGPEAVADTLSVLRDKGIGVFGYSTGRGYNIGAFEKDGIRIAVLAFVKPGRWSKEKHGFGPDSYNPLSIVEEIEKHSEVFDHVIVFPHWGTELVEIPNEADTLNAKRFIDAGASAVIGHHPHISQGIETYRHGLIAYSLGSFIYIPEDEVGYSKKNKNRDISICLTVEFDKDRIIEYKAQYYKYDPVTKIPIVQPDESIKEYASFLDSHIYDLQLFNKQIRETLFKREVRSFLHRFRKKPVKTLYYYMGQLRLKKFKKLFF